MMEQITADTPISVCELTLIPIVRTRIHDNKNINDVLLSAAKEPLAIIVCDIHGVRAFDMCSSEVNINDLIQQIPSLQALLASNH